MKISFPSGAVWLSLGRHVVTYSAGISTALVALHIANPDQAQSFSSAVSQIVSGLTSVATGTATLIALGSAIWAGLSATRTHQVAVVQADRTLQVLTTDSTLAAKVPGVRIVPAQEITNVPKS